jgi:uncharacterized protein (DUF1778 family)
MIEERKQRVTFLVSVDEQERLKNDAEKSGKSLTDFCREKVFQDESQDEKDRQNEFEFRLKNEFNQLSDALQKVGRNSELIGSKQDAFFAQLRGQTAKDISHLAGCFQNLAKNLEKAETAIDDFDKKVKKISGEIQGKIDENLAEFKTSFNTNIEGNFKKLKRLFYALCGGLGIIILLFSLKLFIPSSQQEDLSKTMNEIKDIQNKIQENQGSLLLFEYEFKLNHGIRLDNGYQPQKTNKKRKAEPEEKMPWEK